MFNLNFYIFISTIVSIAICAPANNNNEHVKFVRNARKSTTNRTPREISDHFDITLSTGPAEFWGNDFNTPSPPQHTLEFEQNGDHITPDFSNGLDYPDPELLVGQAARRAAWQLYSKPLFFSDVNHIQLLLKNQDIRRYNGLSGNRLGSLRVHSPWNRYKKANYGYYR